MEKQALDGNDIFVIHSFLTPEECAALIARTEQAGYGDAPITTAAGFVMRKDVRNNERVMIDDVELARDLFERARPFLPTIFRGWEVRGLNERFRFYRYDRGQKFNWHRDGAFVKMARPAR